MRKQINQRVQRGSTVASLEKKVTAHLILEWVFRESKVAKIHIASYSDDRLGAA